MHLCPSDVFELMSRTLQMSCDSFLFVGMHHLFEDSERAGNSLSVHMFIVVFCHRLLENLTLDFWCAEKYHAYIRRAYCLISAFFLLFYFGIN